MTVSALSGAGMTANRSGLADPAMLKPDTLALTAVLALLTALGPLSTDMYLPSLPAIAARLSTRRPPGRS